MEAKNQFSVTDISISQVAEDDYQSFSDFYCGVNEIDDFFHDEVALCSKYRYLIPYKCTLSDPKEIVAFFHARQ